MADAYLAISQVAADGFMANRVAACAAQQQDTGNTVIEDAWAWADSNRWRWAASPGWGEKWDSALASHPDDPDYEPGGDTAVITDADILSTVQALAVEPAP